MALETNIEQNNGLFTKTIVYTDPTSINNTALRAEELITASVTVDGVEYDADEKSIDRIDRVISVAGARYNQAVAAGMSVSDAYESVYVNTIVPWKTKDNAFVSINGATLVEIQTKALENINTVWVKYG